MFCGKTGEEAMRRRRIDYDEYLIRQLRRLLKNMQNLSNYPEWNMRDINITNEDVWTGVVSSRRTCWLWITSMPQSALRSMHIVYQATEMNILRQWRATEIRFVLGGVFTFVLLCFFVLKCLVLVHPCRKCSWRGMKTRTLSAMLEGSVCLRKRGSEREKH